MEGEATVSNKFFRILNKYRILLSLIPLYQKYLLLLFCEKVYTKPAHYFDNTIFRNDTE